ncbi:MAG: hypothetical protein HYT87_02935 [Nitrospirae bacterium]|nr:hypothetical protein [Nitrospirota bacterium]
MRVFKALFSALFLVGAGAIVWQSSGALDQAREKARLAAEDFPAVRTSRVLTGGFASLAGDWWWVKTINFYGNVLAVRRDEKKFLERIAPMDGYLRTTTGFDPWLVEAYYFGGVVLGWDKKDAREGIKLMWDGLRHHPGNWKLWYYLSFNHFFFLKEFKPAADALLRGTLLPNAPQFFVGLAEKVYQNEEFMSMALDYLAVAWSDTRDPQKKEEISRKMKEYGSRLNMEELQKRVNRFKSERRRWPENLDEMVKAGILTEIPPDPLEGKYFLDSEHHVRNTRLKD